MSITIRAAYGRRGRPLAFLGGGRSMTPSSTSLRFSAAFSFFCAFSRARRSGFSASYACCRASRFCAVLSAQGAVQRSAWGALLGLRAAYFESDVVADSAAGSVGAGRGLVEVEAVGSSSATGAASGAAVEGRGEDIVEKRARPRTLSRDVTLAAGGIDRNSTKACVRQNQGATNLDNPSLSLEERDSVPKHPEVFKYFFARLSRRPAPDSLLLDVVLDAAPLAAPVALDDLDPGLELLPDDDVHARAAALERIKVRIRIPAAWELVRRELAEVDGERKRRRRGPRSGGG